MAIVPTVPSARGLDPGSYVDTTGLATQQDLSDAALGSLNNVALTGTLSLNGEQIKPAGQRRSEILRPSAALRETVDRANAPQMVSSSVLATGTLYMSAIPLFKGDVVSSVSFFTASVAAVSPTNWWVGLYDAARNLVAVSTDQTTRAIPATSVITTPVADSGGAAFTVPADGLYYIGIMVAASTMPTVYGSTSTISAVLNQAPKIAGASNTGQTTPPTFPTVAASIASAGTWVYAFVT